MMAETLQCDSYCERLLTSLRILQQDSTLCDLTLIADDEPIRVHRCVMAGSSDYFHAMLTLDMQERNKNEVALTGVPLQGLQQVVRFAYSGQLCCTVQNIYDILLAATHLQMTEAVDLCCRYLMKLTTVSNSIDMYNIAEQFNLPMVKQKSLDLILGHFNEIIQQNEFVRFTGHFLDEILADSRLNMFTELQLFQMALRWLEYDRKGRSEHAYSLMTRIRFPLIAPNDLVDTVMTNDLMKSDPQCLELMLEANRYHMLPSKQPIMQNARTAVRSDTASIVLLDTEEDCLRVYDLADDSWNSLGASYTETFHMQVCSLDNYMYVCGGIELYSSDNPVSVKCYRYDPRFNTWSEIAPMQEPRHHFTQVSDGRSIFAIGGYCSGTFKNTVEQYLVDQDKWIVKTPLDVRLSASAATVHDGKVFLSGGQTDQEISRCLWCYNITSDTWHSRACMMMARMDHAMCCHDNRLYVLGGYDKNIIKAFDVNTVEAYDTETDQWSVVHENSPKISGVHCSMVAALVYLVGGFTYDENKKRDDVFCYNIETNKWKVVTKMTTPAMSVASCTLYIPRHVLSDYVPALL
ncbi:hypothetical protein NP493_370g06016 [Ridgeia piscesae]|uniref:BTB domain-containing protein n=1 Tax=Ridgeia piscesae TaxID=27915 RepID=A0AAD9L2L2_RIDPI|nr:hypothetical protein NP493_370g06016 [Ridgeia piscesae]